jgi:hypothetical protein
MPEIRLGEHPFVRVGPGQGFGVAEVEAASVQQRQVFREIHVTPEAITVCRRRQGGVLFDRHVDLGKYSK